MGRLAIVAGLQTGARGRNRTGTGVTPRGILSPLRLPISPPGQGLMQCENGGGTRNRTEVGGFAVRSMTTLPSRQSKKPRLDEAFKEPAVPIARLPGVTIWSGKRDSNSRP